MTSLNIAVVGSGISGLAAAWLLSQKHKVTLYEAQDRLGGHTNTVNMNIDGKAVPVDTGFICFNEATYPNFIALLDHLKVETSDTVMSFAASMGAGAYEYAGGNWFGMVAQPSNLLRPGHWRMMVDILRFFKQAGKTMDAIPDDETLAQYIEREGYSTEFRDRHLLPMAAAIWSSKMGDMTQYPARAFIRFFHNHGLLKMYRRPNWRSVLGGSKRYIDELQARWSVEVKLNAPVLKVERDPYGVTLHTAGNQQDRFDHVVMATHADEALAALDEPTEAEAQTLGSFGYASNRAILHRDKSYMPKRWFAWASWNYIDWGKIGDNDRPELCVTYWMNSLQKLATKKDVFVTLNPPPHSQIEQVAGTYNYKHPVFDAAALTAQRTIWDLQGQNRTWYCGAHFGAGFHEDGLQAGLAVAEQLGGVRRPWKVADESGRLSMSQPTQNLLAAE